MLKPSEEICPKYLMTASELVVEALETTANGSVVAVISRAATVTLPIYTHDFSAL